MTVNICFHGIGRPRRPLEPGEQAYWVQVDQFHRLLDEIAGWPDARLSFDDSNASDLHYGLPALRERHLTADFFVIAGRVNSAGSLDEQGVRELHRQGMGIGNHGMTHCSWRGMDAALTRQELVTARELLAQMIGAPIRQAACPRGQYDRAALGALRSAGYTEVFTSDRRAAKPGSWLQHRFSVLHDDTPDSLRGRVTAANRLAAKARASAVGFIKRWR